MKIPRLLQAVLAVVGIYFGFILVFDVILAQPIPKSLLTMYMFFVIAGVFMVFTATEKSTRELVDPIKALVDDPGKKRLRNIVFVVVPLVAGFFTYTRFLPGFEAPVELRSIHPAPPSSIKAYGKRFNLMELQNPYRALQEENQAEFQAAVAEGAEIYIRNCHFCHGDKLDGRGPYAEAFNPAPMNFQDVGTIAQLQESFLFWRIVKGGPGLPKEGAPWLSSMPVWEEYLSEDEIWKVILFLYDYTGHRPREWAGE